MGNTFDPALGNTYDPGWGKVMTPDWGILLTLMGNIYDPRHKGRDKVAVVALDEFLAVGEKLKLVRSVPEQITPDIQAIVNHIKTTGEIPAGVTFIPADVRFSYSTNGGKDESE